MSTNMRVVLPRAVKLEELVLALERAVAKTPKLISRKTVLGASYSPGSVKKKLDRVELGITLKTTWYNVLLTCGLVRCIGVYTHLTEGDLPYSEIYFNPSGAPIPETVWVTFVQNLYDEIPVNA